MLGLALNSGIEACEGIDAFAPRLRPPFDMRYALFFSFLLMRHAMGRAGLEWDLSFQPRRFLSRTWNGANGGGRFSFCFFAAGIVCSPFTAARPWDRGFMVSLIPSLDWNFGSVESDEDGIHDHDANVMKRI